MTDQPSWKDRALRRAASLAPAGTRKRRAARLGLAVYREGRDATAGVSAYRRHDAISHTVPFRYDEWLDATAIDLDPASLVPSTATAVVTILPGPGDAASTNESLRTQVRPARAVIDHHRLDGDGLSAFATSMSVHHDAIHLAVVSGDRLEPDALARILDRFDTDPLLDVVTWDDDVWSGRRPEHPLFRPVTYSPDVVLSANPYGRSIAFRGTAVRRAGGLLHERGEDEWWDLLLRMGLTPDRVSHVARVLGHLIDRPQAVGPNGVEVVQAHLDRSRLAGRARRADGTVHVTWSPTEKPRVSVLVAARDGEPTDLPLIDGLRSTTYPDWELVVIDAAGRPRSGDVSDPEGLRGLDHRVIPWDRPFNHAAAINEAARAATGEVLVIVDGDTSIRSPGWLEDLVGWLGVSGVGSVGPS